jgi:hypothetical protein
MGLQTVHERERKLFEWLCSYMRSCECDKEQEKAEKLRGVCSAMAWLLGALLPTDERWNDY